MDSGLHTKCTSVALTSLLGRNRPRWEDNIKMNLRETGWEGVDWIYLGQDRGHWRALVNTVIILQVP